MNETIGILKKHSTVRNFDPKYQVSPEQLELILSSAKQAPSWMNGQAYSIIVYQDDEKQKFAQLLQEDPSNLSNAQMIQQASLFLLFNVNLSLFDITTPLNDEIEPLLISTVDAALALENALIAAESLGFGACVVGGLRKLCGSICATYHYPKYVFPLMGLVIGKATQNNGIKPRIPNSLNVFNAKDLPVTIQSEDIRHYSQTLSQFAQESRYTTSDWQQRFKNFYENKDFSQTTKQILKEQGLI